MLIITFYVVLYHVIQMLRWWRGPQGSRSMFPRNWNVSQMAGRISTPGETYLDVASVSCATKINYIWSRGILITSIHWLKSTADNTFPALPGSILYLYFYAVCFLLPMAQLRVIGNNNMFIFTFLPLWTLWTCISISLLLSFSINQSINRFIQKW